MIIKSHKYSDSQNTPHDTHTVSSLECIPDVFPILQYVVLMKFFNNNKPLYAFKNKITHVTLRI